MTRSRRAGLSRAEISEQPLYARLLGLQYLAPSGFLCFVFLEGSIALGILLGLAELVSWWGVLVLPLTVAVMVKLNDVVAGLLMRPPPTRPATTSRAAASPATPGLAGAQTVRLSPAKITQVRSEDGLPPLRPAPVRRTSAGVDASPGEDRWMPQAATAGAEAGALNAPPVTRQWTDDLDDQQQRARQSAARRYE
jgi:hypothetical protein